MVEKDNTPQLSRMEELVNWLNERTIEYDNNVPTVSDKEWDRKYFELQSLEKELNYILNNSPTHNIIYNVVNSLEKVEHNHPMLSLAKTKDWEEFSNYFDNHKAVVMLKLDGLTASIKYQGGKLISAETRGNGVIGEDITHNIVTCSGIPKRIDYNGELIIDGEVICKTDIFEEKFTNDYANPRNFASGSIRLLDANECAKRNLTFVVWNVVKGFEEENSFSNKLKAISKLNFITVPYISGINKKDRETLEYTAKDMHYPIDGLVGRFDDIEYAESLGSTSHHNKGAFAFKFHDEEYETKLLNIEYEPSRNGELTPVAVFEDVDTGDSIINRASLHNISIMHELLGDIASIGQKIWVCKKNEIIPQITNSKLPLKLYPIEIPRKCPICGEPTEIHTSDSGVKTLHCSNKDCPCRFVNKLEHFFGKKGLDAKGLSKATFNKLYELGWVRYISDVFALSSYQTEWEYLSGFGKKSVSKALESIEACRVCDLEKFIAALGIPLVGNTISKKLSSIFCTWEEFRKAIREGYDFCEIDGFGEEINNALHDYNYAEADFMAENIMIFNEPKEEIKSDKFDGVIFVITGKLKQFKNRAELVSKIESLGGKVTGTVSKKTNYLINNDINSTTGKNAKAKELNIPIISEEDFMNMID